MISDTDFAEQIRKIAGHPENHNEWIIQKSHRATGDCLYLIKRDHKVFLEDSVFNLEYHLVRHPIYCVPVLCFHASNSNGSRVTDYDLILPILKANLAKDTIDSENLYTALTQVDHPVLQTPIWALHPCKTPLLLEQFPAGEHQVITVLSTFGPFLGLNIDHLNVSANVQS